MHKVLLQRGRRGGGAYGQMRRANRTEDQLPSWEGMRAQYSDFPNYREDYDGPMKRWLRSHVGCPWNDIYSELCRVIKPDTKAKFLIKERIKAIENGVSFYYGCFYVDADGLLCEWCFEVEKDVVPVHQATWRWLTEDFVLLQRNGEWKVCQVKPWPDDPSEKVYDHLHEKRVQLRQLKSFYRERIYCVLCRSLSKAELKRFRLVNQPATEVRSSGYPGAEVPKTALRGYIQFKESIMRLSSFQTITAIKPIPGADRIEAASVLGYHTVNKKVEFQRGDLWSGMSRTRLCRTGKSMSPPCRLPGRTPILSGSRHCVESLSGHGFLLPLFVWWNSGRNQRKHV